MPVVLDDDMLDGRQDARGALEHLELEALAVDLQQPDRPARDGVVEASPRDGDAARSATSH
jgi:hypothetical protein